ncbi:PREDICTED: kelch-like protein 5 isoform X2 [Acropora digitifera]|uniref:kelch-like protein 5 isoform X2 n=1 Tax=Acropora digitifera TaxID=70779 RepID=UPI000779F3BE|nr:PREDICTED: kelch-like protein 5 isoform X2 [Acropora digitifera]
MEEEGEAIMFTCSDHVTKTFKKMNGFRKSSLLCDIVLVVKEKTIKAHRLVLAAFSDYFSAMFTSELSETGQAVVNLPDLDPQAVEALVQYAYTSHIEIRVDNVENLLSVSCILQIDEVKDACSEFMKHQLHPSNCLGIRAFAEGHGCNELYKIADAFTKERFVDVVKNQEFVLLNSECIAQLLSSEDLNVTSESQIFEALCAWTEHDERNRKRFMPKLLALVRLPLLAPEFLVDKVEMSPLFRDMSPCRELIIEAMKYQLLPKRRFQLQNPRATPRKATVGKLYVIGGMDSSKGAIQIEHYDPRKNQWSLVAPMVTRRLQFDVAMVGGDLYVVGGRDGLKTLNTVECYNPITKQWSPVQSMNTHRHGLGVAMLGGPLYAVGGHDGWSYLSTVERFDPETKQWNFVASMTTARSTVGVAVLNGKLYAVGGRDGLACLNSMECYDPHTNKWSVTCPMLKRRGGVGVAVLDNFLYAMGGHDAPASQDCSRQFDSVERYNPNTDQWTMVAPMINCRDAVGATCLGDRLYAVGGYDGSKYLSAVESYDPEKNKWEEVASLNYGRAAACVVSVPINPAEKGI